MKRFHVHIGDLRGVYSKLCCEAGSVALETALGFMLMMLMIFGIMECCMMAYTYAVLGDAAREGVRYAIVHGTDSTTCSGPSVGCADQSAINVSVAVTTYATGLAGRLSGIVVTPTYPDGTSTATSRVLVSITYSYAPIFHYTGVTQLFHVSSAGRILY